MRSRDVVGKRIIGINQVRALPDRQYFGPRMVTTQIYLEDGSWLTAHSYEATDQPVVSIECSKPTEVSHDAEIA